MSKIEEMEVELKRLQLEKLKKQLALQEAAVEGSKKVANGLLDIVLMLTGWKIAIAYMVMTIVATYNPEIWWAAIWQATVIMGLCFAINWTLRKLFRQTS
ncbi:MAG: hypothetical protein RIQ53_4572 [Pseudomonadota bacterium]